jgi:hypothetical protein
MIRETATLVRIFAIASCPWFRACCGREKIEEADEIESLENKESSSFVITLPSSMVEFSGP